ncbi:hypothetical protein Tco_1133320 [Tanacetum coccineum]
MKQEGLKGKGPKSTIRDSSSWVKKEEKSSCVVLVSFVKTTAATIDGKIERSEQHMGTSRSLMFVRGFEEQFPEVKGWLVEDLVNYHLKELRCSAQCHTKKSMWINSRGDQAESSKKRPREDSDDESAMKHKIEENDAEKEELRACLDIVLGDEIAMDFKSLDTNEMLDDFDRQDVMDLHRLVKERYETTSPEGYDLMLWGDLKTLFKPSEEDEVWRNQQGYNLIS